jgi:hypothetical protein
VSAAADVARMLTMVPWLLERPGASLAEVAATFRVSEDTVRGDLGHLDFCGLPGSRGRGPVRGHPRRDRVVLRMAEELKRPLRPTPREALRWWSPSMPSPRPSGTSCRRCGGRWTGSGPRWTSPNARRTCWSPIGVRDPAAAASGGPRGPAGGARVPGTGRRRSRARVSSTRGRCTCSTGAGTCRVMTTGRGAPGVPSGPCRRGPPQRAASDRAGTCPTRPAALRPRTRRRPSSCGSTPRGRWLEDAVVIDEVTEPP